MPQSRLPALVALKLLGLSESSESLCVTSVPRPGDSHEWEYRQ